MRDSGHPIEQSGRWSPVPDEAALLVEYRPLALWLAGQFFLPGHEPEDVQQEAMCGLLCGIRTYQPELGARRSFYGLATRMWLNAAVKAANRGKQRMLTDCVYDGHDADGRLFPIVDAIQDRSNDPADLVVARERFADFVASFQTLSPLERRSLLRVYDGPAYTTGPDAKQIDNAIQRARQKLRDAA